MKKITIQKAVVEDIPRIQEVFYRTWLETYPNPEIGVTVEDVEEKFKNRFSEEMIRKRTEDISDPSEDKLFLVAKDGADVVGVCRLEKNDFFNRLVAIYVLPGCQRAGTGSMFWRKAGDFFDEGKETIVQVATYNLKAVSFYEKLGFADMGKRFTEEKLRMPISGVLIPEMEMSMKLKKSNYAACYVTK